jgi:small-conductance mechanosensitive channel
LLAAVALAPLPTFSQSAPSHSLDQQVVEFLDKSVGWYQNRAVEQQMATTPGDILFANNDRPVADQILRLSFDFARASLQMVDNNRAAEGHSSSAADSRRQALVQAASKLDDQLGKTRAELEDLRKRLQTVPPRRRKPVQAQIAETQSQLGLLQARQDILRNILQFMGGGTQLGGLASEIEALERSLPTAIASDGQATLNASNKEGAAALAAISGQHNEPSGIWGILRELFTLSGKLEAISKNIGQTNELAQSVKQMQGPLRDQLKELAARSDVVMNQPDSQDPAVLAQQKSALDALTAQFKLLTAAALPLSKEGLLLEVYQKNLANWYAATKSQYSGHIKNLLVRLLTLGVLIGIILAVFALWRRAIFRYIQDVRRRHQFLLLRRIALWSVITLVILFGLISELGSLATFAGLLTAGVAVALQNVILAMAGYFLLIGKFGVRVGDRVQIAGVFGEVVEIGLIRLHIMELAGSGADAQPTGRVVAFSNSMVFQPTAGLFKQVPGTSFIWHEISLTLAADSNYRLVEQRLRAAVDAALSDYQQDFEQQRRQMERNLSFVSIGSLAPGIRFRLTPAGLEVVLRFPVESAKAAEIDDRVTRELLRTIEEEPKLKLVAAEVPAIRLRTEAADRGAA